MSTLDASTAPQAAWGPAPSLTEGGIYGTADGEERLVWVMRNGVVEYFARRDGGRWTPTLFDRGCPSVEDFAREVGVAPG